jgi:kynurenine formamidase
MSDHNASYLSKQGWSEMNNSQVNNGPRISFSEFEKLFDSIKSWSQYTPENIQRGALNYITPEVVKNSSKEVATGEVVIMGLPWATAVDLDNTKPALHYMTEMGDVDDEQPTCNKDFIGVDYHGKAVSHLDAMTHISFNDQLFGGASSKKSVTSSGSSWATVDRLGPVVTRGVVLDIARLQGVDWIDPGTAVHAEDVLAMEKKFNFTLQQGDCVLLRNGHFLRREKLGVWDPSNFSAGFHFDVMELFKERKISMIGADGDSDVRPSPVEGVHSPIHVLALPALGIPLLDNLNLEAVANKCAELNRWTFQTIIAPLNIPRGTGSPVNPLAVF